MRLLEENQFEVLATNGDTFLGGEDFDIRIIDHLMDEFKKLTKSDGFLKLFKDKNSLELIGIIFPQL